MSYSTNTTILSYFPQLPQTTTSAGYTQTVAIINSHITRADTLIKGKIASRYDIAGFTASVPPLLRTISEDIASYFSFRSWFSQDNQNVNEWTDKFKEAESMLDMIRKGDMDLFNTAGALIAERASSNISLVDSNNLDYQPYFDEDGPLEWKVDSEKLDDINEKR